MPPIFLHMAMAVDVREGVATPLLSEHEGAYYLGATSPDIRVLTRQDRRDTHFFDLGVHDHQDSVAALFAMHPHLRDIELLNDETAAFVAGFIGHLTLDEQWIEGVYRPHFGQLSALGGSDQASLMDRVLQYELDRRRREDAAIPEHIRSALEKCSLAIDVGFLDSEILRRWRDIAVDITRHPPTWERFKFQGGRHVRNAGLDTDAGFQDFLEQVPEILERTIMHVSTVHIDAYLEKATEAARRQAEQFLGIS